MLAPLDTSVTCFIDDISSQFRLDLKAPLRSYNRIADVILILKPSGKCHALSSLHERTSPLDTSEKTTSDKCAVKKRLFACGFTVRNSVNGKM